MLKNLIYGMLLMALGQSMTFFQLQGQFIFSWMKENLLAVCLMGIPVSYIFIKSIEQMTIYFEGQFWPGRLLSFAIGAVVFSILSWFLTNEGINAKTAVCLFLACTIVFIQIFWK